MIIEIISNNTIKIMLDESDLLRYDVSYEKLDRSSPQTKKLLIDLIEIINNEKSIDLSSERLFVEAFPQDQGGCLLYISMLNSKNRTIPDKNSFYTSIVCDIDNPSKLNLVATQTFNMFSHILHNSELYYSDGIYKLIIHTFKRSDKKMQSFLSEYCSISGSGDVACSAIREYSPCLISNNAIEAIIKAEIS